MTFNQIASEYPDRVQVLFSKYGINKSVNGENLLSASLIYGDAFIDELINEIEKEENFFIGYGKLASKIKGAFTKAKQMLNKHSDADPNNQGKSGKGRKLLQIVAGLFSDEPEKDLKTEMPEKKDNTKLFVFGGLGLLALIIVVIVATR